MTTKREILNDGSIRLKSEDCAFLFTRLKPSVMLTTITGHDTGEFGTAPLDQIEAEAKRFGQPVSWFVDAGAAVNASPSVSKIWSAWFPANKNKLKRVHILVGDKPVDLTISIATHFSRTGELIKIYKDGDLFANAIRQEAPKFGSLTAAARFSEEPAKAGQEVLSDGSLRLSSDKCSFVYRTLKPGVLLTTISGDDSGEFGDLPLDTVKEEITRSQNPLTWFIDARNVSGTSNKVAEDWSAWLLANHKSFKRVYVLADPGAFHLKLAIAKHIAGIDRLLKLYADSKDFEEAVFHEIPSYSLLR